MSKEPDQAPKDKLELYEKLVATQPEVERKGATMPYTPVNGHMFSFLAKSGSLGLRLPKEEREAFLEKYETTLAVSYGAVMKEYVAVPEALLENTDELKEDFAVSYEYVKSLKPKETKREEKG